MSLQRWRPLFGSDRGAVATEAVIILPLLIWAYTAMFVFWDAYKSQNINLRAAYTIADMISREQRPIDQNFIDGARSLYQFLNAGDANQQLRVTVVSMRLDASNNPYLELEWSHGTEGLMCHNDIRQVEDRIPIMAPGDTVIVVDTTTDWTPIFNVGLPAKTMRETVVTSPRFVPRVDCFGTTCVC